MFEPSKQLTQEFDRELIDHFYRPKFASFRYFSFDKSCFEQRAFIQEVIAAHSILMLSLDCDQFKPIYSDLKDRIVKSCTITATFGEGRFQELKEFIRSWSIEFFKSKGITTFTTPFICNPSCFAGVAPPIASRSTIVCSDFAFLQLAEEHAYSKFFMDMSKQPFKEILKEWGYEFVDSPQPGDLVVYFNDEQAEHFGVWNHNGNVVSKWGEGLVHEHPLHLVLKAYGEKVVFCRKPLYKEILQELASRTEDSAEDLCAHFKNLIIDKAKVCHKNSFALYFFEEWNKQFSEIVAGFPKDSTANQVIETLEKVAKEIPFDISRCV